MGTFQLRKAERWQKTEYDDYYISSHGRFKSIKYKSKKEYIFKPKVTRFGYLSVILSLGSREKKKHIHLHRLVAEAFLKKPKGTSEVNHIDSNKKNNSVLNLEWVTKKQNAEHRKKQNGYASVTGKNHWTQKQPWRKKTGEKNGRAILTEKQVRKIKFGSENKTASAELARKYGVSKTVIGHIKHGNLWRHINE